MEYNNEQEKIIEPDNEGGWVDTHHYDLSGDLEEKVSDMTLDSEVNFIPFNIMYNMIDYYSPIDQYLIIRNKWTIVKVVRATI